MLIGKAPLVRRSRLFGRRVNPARQRVVKLNPSMPPERGGIVLVDGVRCRVMSCWIRWDGPRWTILRLRVKDAA